jgi:PhnB protein
MKVQSYLFFDGRCEEAIDFYRKAVGAEVEMLMRFKDNPEPPQAGSDCAHGAPDKVMHASIKIGDTVIMASDGHCAGKPVFQGFSLSYNAANEAEANRVFKALGADGQVQVPLTKTFFSPCFGMLADRFGVGWMVIVQPN